MAVFFSMQSLVWLFTNFLALSLAILAVKSLQLTKFKDISQLMAFFFVYDFAGVFASQAITKVAKGLPVYLSLKIVVPKLGQDGYSIIGLGDLIVPGILCSFCLRIDFIRAYRKGQTLTNPLKNLPNKWPSPLFLKSLLSYVIGLLSAQIVFAITKKP